MPDITSPSTPATRDSRSASLFSSTLAADRSSSVGETRGERCTMDECRGGTSSGPAVRAAADAARAAEPVRDAFVAAGTAFGVGTAGVAGADAMGVGGAESPDSEGANRMLLLPFDAQGGSRVDTSSEGMRARMD
jgi:hypothetical protein